jgi:cell division protein FtsQ
MARKSGSTILPEHLYPSPDESAGPVAEELDDARLLDLDVEESSPFLRGQKRVSVRRGSLPKKAATQLSWVVLALGLLFLVGLGTSLLYHYGERSWRFRVQSSDDIEISGLQNATRSQVMEVMGGDIGRNIFFIPLDERQKQLEQIPWVASAAVMRFVPNRLKVAIRERTPVAFARIGPRIELIDGVGTLMELPSGKRKYSFPVILGMNQAEPLSTRTARMKIYNDLIAELDSGGAHYSEDLSEVDLSDADDVKVLANNPQGEVLVHLGSASYLERYKLYVAHAQQWREQFDRLDSVDLRYDHQIIVNPDMPRSAQGIVLSPAAAKQALAAGVKPAALIHFESTHRAADHSGGVPAAPAKREAAPPAPAVSGSAKAIDKAATSPSLPSGAAAATKPPAEAGADKKAPIKKKPVARKHRKPAAKKTPIQAKKGSAPATVDSSSQAADGATKKPSPAVAKNPENR